jgi:hypothetical protein
MKTVTTDSLTLFSTAATTFFNDELQLAVPDEVIKYILIYRLDSFSAAYANHRHAPSERTVSDIRKIVDIAKEEHSRQI